MSHKTARKYSRIARLFDLVELPIEQLLFSRLRAYAVSHVKGEVLELGVGTGKNLPYYSLEQKVTAIDFSPGMLHIAKQKLAHLPHEHIELLEMDIQTMQLNDNSYDSSLCTFVFCTVPQPDVGLKELLRVLKPGGIAVFLEHQRSQSVFLNLFLYMMEPMSRLLLGTSMIRTTQENIEKAGFIVEKVENKFFDVVRLIIAHKPE